jgi:hypothetical protein
MTKTFLEAQTMFVCHRQDILISDDHRESPANRVPRWFDFKTKIPIWVNFGRTLRFEKVDLFYAHLEYFTDT